MDFVTTNMNSQLSFCAPISLRHETRMPLRVSSMPTLRRVFRQHTAPAPCQVLMNQSRQETPSEPDTAVDLPQASDQPQGPRYSQRARLREETEAPFRKARMFVYGGSVLSATVGAFIASLRVIAALTGVSGVQPLNETLPNIGINLAVIAVCGALLRFETKAGERRLERMSRGARIASLRIQDAVTRQVRTLKDLRGRTRVVLVAGPVDKVVQAVDMSEEVREGISKSNLMIIPYVTDQDDTDADLRNWRMKPYAIEEWKRWYDAERDVVNARLRETSDVLVIVVRLDGRVGARSVGTPMWSRLIGEISKLPKRDQYGKP